jgi:hypothetical protein
VKSARKYRAARATTAAGLGAAVVIALSACGSTSASSTAKAAASSAAAAAPSGKAPSGKPASGQPQKPPSGGSGPGGSGQGSSGQGGSGGSGPGGTGSSTPVSGTGAYSLSGGSAVKSGTTVTAAATNESGVLVKSSGKLTLENTAVTTTGKSSSSDDSSFYGLDSGVLAFTNATITETGGTVRTTGDGANAVFAYGSGAHITISGTKITAAGQYAHGIMASGGGSITATGLTVSTAGASSAAVATDRGGGTLNVIGGTYRTSGHNSPGLYSTGTITVRGAIVDAAGAEAAVVEGSNSITVTNSSLTGSVNRGVMIYQSFSGDAQGTNGIFTQAGGSLTARQGPLFFVTNTTATINLTGVKLADSSGTLLDAAASSWGTSGSNGGNVTLNAKAQTLAGSVAADKVSTVTLHLTDGSKLTGAVNTADSAKKVALSLDSASKWTVTGTSYVTVLNDSAGISGTSITNIVGNGHNVYYSKSANPSLGGKTYTLAGGGKLIPV